MLKAVTVVITIEAMGGRIITFPNAVETGIIPCIAQIKEMVTIRVVLRRLLRSFGWGCFFIDLFLSSFQATTRTPAPWCSTVAFRGKMVPFSRTGDVLRGVECDEARPWDLG